MVTGAEREDTEPEEPVNGQGQIDAKGNSGRRSFAKLRRELTDDELASPAVQRMLLDEIERLDAERVDLAAYQNKFHAVDKRVGILEEKFKSKVAIEVIHVACLTVGAASLGYVPAAASNGSSGWMFAAFGLILILAAIVAKSIKVRP